MKSHVGLLMAVGVLGGCMTPPAIDAARFQEPDLAVERTAIPPNADPRLCWGRHVTPAVIETVEEDIVVQPAQVRADGSISVPPITKSETLPRVIEERREIWFEVPCVSELTPDFIMSLQRALAARGLYRGPINGEMDGSTRAAIRQYQSAEGLDSPIISTAAARELGLLVASPAPDA